MHLSGNNPTRLWLHHDSRPLDLNDFSRGLRLHCFSLFWTFSFLSFFSFLVSELSTSVVGGMSLGTPSPPFHLRPVSLWPTEWPSRDRR